MDSEKDTLATMVGCANPFFDQMDQIIFIKNIDFTYAGCNKNLVKFSRLNDVRNILEKTDYDLPWAEDTGFYRKIDESVIRGNDAKIFMQVRVATGEKIAVTQHKTPVIDPHTKNIIGIMAVMSEVNNSDLTSFLKKLENTDNNQFGFVKSQYKSAGYEKYALTPRESEVFFYVLRGMTNKMIARVLSLSPRTIEKFVENVKHKFGCAYKSDLIEKAFKEDLIRLIPPEITVML